MLTNFVPADRVSSYEASPYKGRLDLIGQRLIEQRYLPVATEQHVREWLRFTMYLQKRGLSLPQHSHETVARAYFSRRVRGPAQAELGSSARLCVFFLRPMSKGDFVAGLEDPTGRWPRAVDRSRSVCRFSQRASWIGPSDRCETAVPTYSLFSIP